MKVTINQVMQANIISLSAFIFVKIMFIFVFRF